MTTKSRQCTTFPAVILDVDDNEVGADGRVVENLITRQRIKTEEEQGAARTLEAVLSPKPPLFPPDEDFDDAQLEDRAFRYHIPQDSGVNVLPKHLPELDKVLFSKIDVPSVLEVFGGVDCDDPALLNHDQLTKVDWEAIDILVERYHIDRNRAINIVRQVRACFTNLGADPDESFHSNW